MSATRESRRAVWHLQRAVLLGRSVLTDTAAGDADNARTSSRAAVSHVSAALLSLDRAIATD